MLKTSRSDNQIRVETGAVIFEWDLLRGGQLTGCIFKGRREHAVLRHGEPAPNLRIVTAGSEVSLADTAVEVDFETELTDRVAFTTRGRLADCLTVEQRYEVFREGGLFCEFCLVLDDGARLELSGARMSFPFDILTAQQVRQNYICRDVFLKQDVTCVHVLQDTRISIVRDEAIDVPHLLPLYGLDLGWEESRYYSNRVDAVIEDSTSLGGGMLAPLHTEARERDGAWELTWTLCRTPDTVIEAPFLYRNRWALFCGAARTEAGGDVDPAGRNNVLGARVCHMMYPYVREGNDWPWCSVPMRQTFYQDAQVATENPAVERVDEAADLGANILILHQFWMVNGGSNGEPAADYRAFDPAWLRATVARAHEHDMRVALYMRGIEQFSLYTGFFEEYLTRDLDGLYVDWSSPFTFGFTKGSPWHNSVHNWFMFSRALRQCVGEKGFLIGHTTMQNHVSYATFDATLTGEFSVLHSGLLDRPEISTSYTGIGSCGVHLMAGNSPDRAQFSSPKAAAITAGLGYSTHPFMEPGKRFADCNGYIQPLWDLWRSMGGDPVRVLNPATGASDAFTWSDDALHPVLYVAADGTALLIVANLGEETVTGSVTVHPAEAGLPAETAFAAVDAAGTFRAEPEGLSIKLQDMPPYSFCEQIAGKRK